MEADGRRHQAELVLVSHLAGVHGADSGLLDGQEEGALVVLREFGRGDGGCGGREDASTDRRCPSEASSVGRAITNEHRERSRFVRRMQPTSGVTLQRNYTCIYLKWKYAAGRQGNVPWERAQAVAATNVAIHNERFVARLEFLLRVSMMLVSNQFWTAWCGVDSR